MTDSFSHFLARAEIMSQKPLLAPMLSLQTY